MKFLIIDDDAVERTLTVKTLRDKFVNAQIVEVDSRIAFDEKIVETDFDLVITEFQLGWTDGLTLFKTIKSHHACLPVIMLTNSGSEDIAATAIKIGMADYIVKRNRHTLLEEIERSLLEAKKRGGAEIINSSWMGEGILSFPDLHGISLISSAFPQMASRYSNGSQTP